MDGATNDEPLQSIPWKEELPLDGTQASTGAQFMSQRHPQTTDDNEEGNNGNLMPIVKRESPGMDEEKFEQELRPGIATVIDLTHDDTHEHDTIGETQNTATQTPQRNAIPNEQFQLASFQLICNSVLINLQPGMVVEIDKVEDLYHASFLQIQYIISTPDGVVLRGLPFSRTRYLRGKLSRRRNEVCLLLKIDADDERSHHIQAAIDVPAARVIHIRELLQTNASFPARRFHRNVYQTIEEVERDGVLVCRWKYRLIYRNAAARENKESPFEYILDHLTASDVYVDVYRVSDTARLNEWRGSKVRGGSYNNETKQDLDVIEDLDEDFDAEKGWILKSSGQRYTMGDMFSGAGGTSLGAQQAGFHIRVACDIDLHACRTHRDNFPEADLREEDIWKFIQEDLVWGGRSDYVDVLHLSPPCQFWSPAHTVAGKNDEANIAVLFSCYELVKKLKPRVFTLEQTFGILHPRFEHYFNALIHGFTQYSYSVRWKVVNLLEWGLPSRRNRLIMIGSCPGEKLPTFPANTHGKYPSPENGLLPFVTVMDAMRRISPDATMQEKYQEKDRIHHWKPWNPHVPLARCITTHGGYGNYHYNGSRHFTLRELATMNGFPASYQFHHKNAKKQIGNAFPPCVVRLLYGHLLEWLEHEDHVRPVEAQSTYEEEPEYDVEDSEVEDDEVELVRVRVKRQSGSNGDVEMMDVDGPISCIDPGQLPHGHWGGVIDLTSDTPQIPGSRSPIIILDDEDDEKEDL